MAVSTQLPHLADLVVHQILGFVPTKVAVRMMFVSKQWEGVWFLDPILDFDEGTGHYQHDHDQHEKFIKFVNNILKRYMEFCDQKQKHSAAKRFRLCMMSYLSGDAPNVDKWLRLLFERISVEQLDISLLVRGVGKLLQGDLENYYSVSRKTLVNAKSLTSLNLECVTIKHMDEYCSSTSPIKKKALVPSADLISKCLLPSLKTMSLKTVHFLDKGNKNQWKFNYGALFSLIWECPYIEYLSLTSCCFKNSGHYQYLCSSSLKFLEIDECNSVILCVREVVNLESFRLVSSVLEDLTLTKCVNLKDMSIFAPRLEALDLVGCHDVVVTILNDVPELWTINFQGYLKSEISLKNIGKNYYAISIALLDKWDGELTTFKSVRDFLENLVRTAEKLTLFVDDFKAIIFPESFRQTVSVPCPMVKRLYLAMKNPPTEERDIDDLKDSLRWMAPLVTHDIIPRKHNDPSTVPRYYYISD